MKSDKELFLDSLRALQHTLLSGAAQIETILSLADRPVNLSQESTCPHPAAKRVAMSTMGHAGRFFCQQCEQEVEG